jgi:hypothetical protein
MDRVSLSTTAVYHLSPAQYPAVAAAVKQRLGELGYDPDPPDFAAIRGSVLEYLPTAKQARYSSPLRFRPPSAGHRLGLILATATEAAALVTFSEAYTSVSVSINLYFASTRVDDVVALAQSAYTRQATPNHDAESVRSLVEARDRVAADIGVASQAQVTEHFRCAEIRGIGACRTADEAVRRYPRALYGVLICDEGWRYVDDATARAAIGEVWGTRSFVGVAAKGDGCLLLNFRPPGYSAMERRFSALFFNQAVPYFSHGYRVAGLEHGPFLAMELCSYRKCIVEDLNIQLRTRSDPTSPRPLSLMGGIRQRAYRRSLYRDLVQGMGRLQLHPPTELGALDSLVEARSGLPERLRYLDEMVRAFEAEEQMNYMYRVNSAMAMITALGLVVAVLSAVLAILVAR